MDLILHEFGEVMRKFVIGSDVHYFDQLWRIQKELNTMRLNLCTIRLDFRFHSLESRRNLIGAFRHQVLNLLRMAEIEWDAIDLDFDYVDEILRVIVTRETILYGLEVCSSFSLVFHFLIASFFILPIFLSRSLTSRNSAVHRLDFLFLLFLLSILSKKKKYRSSFSFVRQCSFFSITSLRLLNFV